MVACLREIRERARDGVVDGKVVIPVAEWSQYKLKIISHNNFPTAAGLASSASGYACFGSILFQFATCSVSFGDHVQSNVLLSCTVSKRAKPENCLALPGESKRVHLLPSDVAL